MERNQEAGNSSLEQLFGPVISSYSRAQAIEDGVLVDVSSAAREAGFKYPVAMTRAAFEQTVTVPPGLSGQDESGRLWDVLYMLHCAIKRGQGGQRTDFELYVRSSSSRARLDRRDLVQLYALCGPDDEGEPVITILQPGED